MSQYVEYFFEHNRSIPYFQDDKQIGREASFFNILLNSNLVTPGALPLRLIKFIAINDQVGAYHYQRTDFLEAFTANALQFNQFNFDFSIYACDIIVSQSTYDLPQTPPTAGDPLYPPLPTDFCGVGLAFAHSIRCFVRRACEVAVEIFYRCEINVQIESINITIQQNGFGYNNQNLRTQITITSNIAHNSIYTAKLVMITDTGRGTTETDLFTTSISFASNTSVNLDFVLPPVGSKLLLNNFEYDVSFKLVVIDNNVNEQLLLQQPQFSVSYTQKNLITVASITGLLNGDFTYVNYFRHIYETPSGTEDYEYSGQDLYNYNVVELPNHHQVGGADWQYRFVMRVEMYNRYFITRKNGSMFMEYFLSLASFKQNFVFQNDSAAIICSFQAALQDRYLQSSPPNFVSNFRQLIGDVITNDFNCYDINIDDSCTTNIHNATGTIIQTSSPPGYAIKPKIEITNTQTQTVFSHETDYDIKLEDCIFKICSYVYRNTSGKEYTVTFVKKVNLDGEKLFLPIAYAIDSVNLFNPYKRLLYLHKNKKTIEFAKNLIFYFYEITYHVFPDQKEMMMTSYQILWPVPDHLFNSSLSYDDIIERLYREFINYISTNKIFLSSFYFSDGATSKIEFEPNIFNPFFTNELSNAASISLGVNINVDLLPLFFFINNKQNYNGSPISLENFSVDIVESQIYQGEHSAFFTESFFYRAFNQNESFYFSPLSPQSQTLYIQYVYNQYNIFDFQDSPYVNNIHNHQIQSQGKSWLASTTISTNVPDNAHIAIEAIHKFSDNATAVNSFIQHRDSVVNTGLYFLVRTYFDTADSTFLTKENLTQSSIVI